MHMKIMWAGSPGNKVEATRGFISAKEKEKQTSPLGYMLKGPELVGGDVNLKCTPLPSVRHPIPWDRRAANPDHLSASFNSIQITRKKFKTPTHCCESQWKCCVSPVFFFRQRHQTSGDRTGVNTAFHRRHHVM